MGWPQVRIYTCNKATARHWWAGRSDLWPRKKNCPDMRQWIILRSALAVTVGKGRISANLMAWQICLLRAGEDLHHCSFGRYQNTLSSLSCFGCIDTSFEKCVFFLRNFGYFFSEQDSNVTASYRTMGSISYRTAQKKAFVAQLTFVPNVLFHGLIKQLYSICFAL